MDQEETKTDAPVKPAKTRTPRKNARSKAPAAAPDGDAGVSAASPAPVRKTSKPRAPRRKKETPKENPVAAETPAPAPVAESVAASAELPEKTPPEQVRKNDKPRQHEPGMQQAQAPAAVEQKAPKAAPQEETPDIPESPTEFRKPEPVPGFSMPEVVGGNEGGGNNRRKRRRNRNRNREDNTRDQQQNQQALRVDPEELYRRAWKIFLGEVTEEGLALMDDRTAAEASRRAFKVAEIFLLEAARHRPAPELEKDSDSESESVPQIAELAE